MNRKPYPYATIYLGHASFIQTGVNLKFRNLLQPVAALVFVLSAAGSGQTPSKLTLDYVLSMMDRSAADFHSLSADVDHIKYTAVVKDTSVESGQILVRKDDKLRIDFRKPDPRTILRNGDNIFIYTPKINRVEEYNIGKNRALADQYLALGFGSRTEKLQKSFDITLTGEEDLDGRKTALIVLTPKSDEARKQINKIEMWIDESSWMPIQSKFFEGAGGDYFISKYTKVMKNLKLGDSQFKPDWPKDAKVEKPRG